MQHYHVRKHRYPCGISGPPIHPLPYGQREYPFNESEPDAPQLCLKKQDSIVRPLHLSPAVPSSERIPYTQMVVGHQDQPLSFRCIHTFTLDANRNPDQTM